jgi:tetratricopeptide (TPR) repeat protein
MSTILTSSTSSTGEESEKMVADLQRELRSLYAEQDFDRALDIVVDLEDITTRMYGENHPVTASVVNNHALLKRATGEYEAAVELFSSAIQKYEESVGKDHTSTATALHNLGLTYKSMYESGTFTGVEELQLQDRAEEALRESMSRRSKEHVDRATTMYILASVRGTQGKNEESVELFDDALMILRSSYEQSKGSGQSGLRLATGLNNYGYWLKMNGKYNDALIRYQESYELREKHAGKNHMATIISLQNIAELLASQGDEDEANIVRKEIMNRVDEGDK